MGSPRRLRKLYEKPKKLWDSTRLEQERKLVTEYGLRNARELWRAKTILRQVRREARRLLAARGPHVEESAQRLLARAKRYFVKKADATLDDILALTERDVLERRLQTVVLRKGFAHTVYQARQFVVHGHVCVGSDRCTSPSRLISLEEESGVAWAGKPLTALANPDSEPAAPAAEAAAVKAEEKAGENVEEKAGHKAARKEEAAEAAEAPAAPEGEKAVAAEA